MIKKKLKAALITAGLDEGLAQFINVSSEAEIPAAIAKLKAIQGGDEDDDPAVTPEEFVTSEAFNNWVEKNGFDGLLKLNKKLQSGHDKKVTQGIETAINKALGKPNPEGGTGGGGGTPPKPDDDGDEMPKWFKPFAEKLAEVEASKTRETKLEKAKAALASSKIPKKLHESWANRIDPDSEKPVEDQIKGLEEEYKVIHAEAIGRETYEFPETNPDSGGNQNGKITKSDLEKYKSKAKLL